MRIRQGIPLPPGVACPDGTTHDAVGYAILRSDWQAGTVTPPDWNDEPEATSDP
jgi:hypothetical protein